jgi:four helix bundle protein
MQRFTQLKVWRRSHEFALSVYRETLPFPKHEAFGVTSQLRRSAVSVPANIAEGSKRRSGREYAHMLNIAEGSAAETEYLLLLSRELGYLESSKADELIGEVREIASMLSGLRVRVEGGA